MKEHFGAAESVVGLVGQLAERALRAELRSAAPDRGMDCFDLKVSLTHQPSSLEDLRPEAAVIHLGRRTALGRCTVFTPDGALVAVVSATYRVAGGNR